MTIGSETPQVVQASPLPVSAVQALYHAATGKTEKLRKNFSKAVIVTKNDVDQLNNRIKQQMEHYNVIGGPTVTVNVTFDNHESQQFSSWQRFRIFDIGRSQIVSDIALKFEFLIKLPESDVVQRYVITVSVDSRLPLVKDENWSQIDLPIFLLDILDSNSVSVSIDFVDYIVARNFSQAVEDWYNCLEVAGNPSWIKTVHKFIYSFPHTFGICANFCVAAFIAAYVYKLNSSEIDSRGALQFLCVALLMWTLSYVFFDILGKKLTKIISNSTVPTCIVMTQGDERAYNRITIKAKKLVPSLITSIFSALVAVGLNVLASYLYSWMTKI